MTTTSSETPPPSPDGPPPSGPRVTREDLRDVNRLRRTVGPRRTVAGVAGGLARHFDIDPVIVKVAFVVLAFFGGAGIFLYGALWLLMPDEITNRATISLDERSLSFALVGVAVLAALFLLGAWSGQWFPWPLAIIAVIVALFINRRDRSAPPPPAPYGYQPPPAPYGTPAPAPYGTPQAGAAAPEQGAPTTYPGATYGTAPAHTPQGTTAPSAYAASAPPVYTAPAYTPPTWTAPPPPPPNPRKRGPILFWFTCALVIFGMGVLGTIDLAGAAVPAAAYPALGLGLIGAMLVLGAFWGRAGGLIALGLLTLPPLAIASIADNYEGERLHPTPVSSTEVLPEYHLDSGELILDLTDVSDPARLVDRPIHVTGNLGRIEVRLPRGLGVDYDLRVGGPGSISVGGASNGGIDIGRNGTIGGRLGEIDLEVDLDIGEIEVTSPEGFGR